MLPSFCTCDYVDTFPNNVDSTRLSRKTPPQSHYQSLLTLFAYPFPPVTVKCIHKAPDAHQGYRLNVGMEATVDQDSAELAERVAELSLS